MADLPTLQARLAEAEAAYDRVVLGDHSTASSTEGSAANFQTVDINVLARHIRALKRQISRAGGVVDLEPAGPAHVVVRD